MAKTIDTFSRRSMLRIENELRTLRSRSRRLAAKLRHSQARDGLAAGGTSRPVYCLANAALETVAGGLGALNMQLQLSTRDAADNFDFLNEGTRSIFFKTPGLYAATLTGTYTAQGEISLDERYLSLGFGVAGGLSNLSNAVQMAHTTAKMDNGFEDDQWCSIHCEALLFVIDPAAGTERLDMGWGGVVDGDIMQPAACLIERIDVDDGGNTATPPPGIPAP